MRLMATTYQIAAARLTEARRLRQAIDRLPEEQRPRDIEDALATQREVLRLAGEDIGGWKCSVPNGDRILIAPLPASTVQRISPCSIVRATALRRSNRRLRSF